MLMQIFKYDIPFDMLAISARNFFCGAIKSGAESARGVLIGACLVVVKGFMVSTSNALLEAVKRWALLLCCTYFFTRVYSQPVHQASVRSSRV